MASPDFRDSLSNNFFSLIVFHKAIITWDAFKPFKVIVRSLRICKHL